MARSNRSSEEKRREKEQRRAEAQARAELNKRLKKRRVRLKDLEASLEASQARYDELMTLMASEELYAQPDKFDAAMKEYSALKKKIPAIEEEWLSLSEEIEQEVADAQS